MEKQKIFFSYSRADGSEFALRLAVDLKKEGLDVWIDQEDIRAGLDWDMEIEKALKSCDCVLFLETEKSVVSNNVLDEVYYALDQNKRVIPLIYVDSKTPFRLNRLQHVDFTKSYDSGLALLLNELKGNTPAVSYSADENTSAAKPAKLFSNKNYRVLLIVACIALLTTVVVVFTAKKRSTAPAENNKAVVLSDSITNQTGRVNDVQGTSVTDSADAKDREIEEKISPVENRRKVQKTADHSAKVNNRFPDITKTENNLGILNEDVEGSWSLSGVEPKARLQRGYLKVEPLSENKVNIRSDIQFYYPDSDASSSLIVFNAFATCNSCRLANEMKLNAEDISVGSRTVEKLKEDQADGRKAGEVIFDAGYNKSIHGKISLQFVDHNTAIIKVSQPLTIALQNGLMLEPFVYTFRFKKND